MVPQPDAARLSHLQANAHRTDVQEEIRREIHAGTVRVVPLGTGIAIVPAGPPAHFVLPDRRPADVAALWAG